MKKYEVKGKISIVPALSGQHLVLLRYPWGLL
jgi:hypothetical protein